MGHFLDVGAYPNEARSTPKNEHRQFDPLLPKSAESFCGMGLKFSEAWARRLNNDVGDHVGTRQTHRRFWQRRGLRAFVAGVVLFFLFLRGFSTCGVLGFFTTSATERTFAK